MYSQSPKITECSSNGDRQTGTFEQWNTLSNGKKKNTVIKIKFKKT